MIRRSFLAVPFLSLVAACSINTETSSPNGSDSDSDTTPGNGSDVATSATLPFKPSNLKLDGIDASKLGDFVVTSADCSIHTETKEVGCGDMDALAYVVVDQPGAGKIGVYVAKNVRIEPNASLKPRGTYALAIVALEDFDVRGGIDVGALRDYPTAGGFVDQGKEEMAGGGAGGGGAGSSTNGAGGGSYCGIGGKGAAFTGGKAAAGGVVYGTPENVPLVGGSSGGSAALSSAGTGGGAVQLVAGKTFSLAATGFVSAGGGGGLFVGGASSQHGAGGGSGGAILIEAPTVSILGTLAANGGAGGSKENGQDATIGAGAATSQAQTNGTKGGVGSSQEAPNGGDGEHFTGDNASGGGGGAGRIRVNSESGNVILSAKVLSPSANGACTTEGKIAK